MAKQILIHPANADELNRVPCSSSDPITELAGLRIVYSRAVPLRATKDVWHPPESDRLCVYGPEDECWMRPLGLGYVETVDDGPWIAVMENGVPDLWQVPVAPCRFLCKSYSPPTVHFKAYA